MDWCCMFKKSRETINHLLLHCEVPRALWVSIYLLFFCLECAMPQRVVDLFASWRGQFGSHCNLKVWMLAPLCLMWCIWRERFARNFKDCERSVLELKAILLKSLYGKRPTTVLIILVSYSLFGCAIF